MRGGRCSTNGKIRSVSVKLALYPFFSRSERDSVFIQLGGTDTAALWIALKAPLAGFGALERNLVFNLSNSRLVQIPQA